jgi:hypothetical protein
LPTQKRIYVRIVEKALGKELPAGAIIHHVDCDRSNNRNDNLVILQDTGEHLRLHRRLAVLKAGGNPWTEQLCCVCHTPKPLAEFPPSKRTRSSACHACEIVRLRVYKNRKRGKPDDWVESAEERSQRNRRMAKRRWEEIRLDTTTAA